ncbi:hypothetical protein [Lacinutrix sp. Bg11-31]|uniref:hypothetical protein n=1 Tax=Lacinutrix sp. Bg11-31 TaxID=2057808 RepID=UPI000C316C2E|nr:hypothetical protein [Lacinutrix sp. Bg11-31]AUC81965.1 hypothetical protein CW733_07410 [Lacinutrix sp. Bg11-31]
MKIAEFNVRCYVCWKQFLIPCLSEFSYGEFLFVNYKTRKFRYFNYFENENIEKIVTAKLNSDSTFENENNYKKRDIRLKLIAKLSDGEFEPIFSNVKCPRCKIGFHSMPNNRSGMTNIEKLTFKITNKKSMVETINELSL